jgi:hypothetical protein
MWSMPLGYTAYRTYLTYLAYYTLCEAGEVDVQQGVLVALKFDGGPVRARLGPFASCVRVSGSPTGGERRPGHFPLVQRQGGQRLRGEAREPQLRASSALRVIGPRPNVKGCRSAEGGVRGEGHSRRTPSDGDDPKRPS